MKFQLEKASDPFDAEDKWVEIRTIKALWAFVEEHGPIIVDESPFRDKGPRIVIYDTYVE